MGQIATDGPDVSQRAHEYLQAIGRKLGPGQPCPCIGTAFVSWVAIQDGIVPPARAEVALSWITWGEPLAEPQPGALVILTDATGRSQHDLGLVVRQAQDRIYVVGAPAGVVETRAYARSRVMASRRPPRQPANVSLPAPELTATPVAATPAAIPPAQPVDLRITLDHAGAVEPRREVPAEPRQPLQPQAVTVTRHPDPAEEDLEVFRTRAVLAIAMASETHKAEAHDPDSWTATLAQHAADITSARSKADISRAVDSATAYMTTALGTI